MNNRHQERHEAMLEATYEDTWKGTWRHDTYPTRNIVPATSTEWTPSAIFLQANLLGETRNSPIPPISFSPHRPTLCPLFSLGLDKTALTNRCIQSGILGTIILAVAQWEQCTRLVANWHQHVSALMTRCQRHPETTKWAESQKGLGLQTPSKVFDWNVFVLEVSRAY